MYPPAREAILQRTIADALRIGIDLRGHIQDYRVIQHPHEYYALRPRAEALRPTQDTPVEGLVLAGDSNQPFVSSIKGAAISGERAARAVNNARSHTHHEMQVT